MFFSITGSSKVILSTWPELPRELSLDREFTLSLKGVCTDRLTWMLAIPVCSSYL